MGNITSVRNAVEYLGSNTQVINSPDQFGSCDRIILPGVGSFSEAITEVKEKWQMKGNDKIIFTGYIKNQNDLSSLYQNCYCYIHGHEFGGTNPTMINALFINCPVLALNRKGLSSIYRPMI